MESIQGVFSNFLENASLLMVYLTVKKPDSTGTFPDTKAILTGLLD